LIAIAAVSRVLVRYSGSLDTREMHLHLDWMRAARATHMSRHAHGSRVDIYNVRVLPVFLERENGQDMMSEDESMSYKRG